jgi:pimeloyl-ACP methyl ester carboxylesterase
MRVAPVLLDAARDDRAAAADMIVAWGFAAGLGGGPAPGLRMAGAGGSLLRAAAPGVLHADLTACNTYAAGLERARAVAAPTLFLLGGRDRMTRPKAAAALIEAIPGAETVVLAGAGHMMMSESSREVTRALAGFL